MSKARPIKVAASADQGKGEGGFEMTRRVTLKLTGEIPARGEASLACSLGPGAFTRRTAYILCVCACLEGSLLFSGRS